MISPVKIWRNQKNIGDLVGKKGRIISWTMIKIPPQGFENQAPYPVALIKLDDKKTIIVQMVDYVEKDLRFGRKVVIVVRRRIQPEENAVIPYNVKVKPI
jgi:uncharacterized OB-fold protein